jgi:hypothetical protein
LPPKTLPRDIAVEAFTPLMLVTMVDLCRQVYCSRDHGKLAAQMAELISILFGARPLWEFDRFLHTIEMAARRV